MKILVKVLGVVLSGILTAIMVGCSFSVSEIQDIDISYYKDKEKDKKLAEDLMYYDPRYLAMKIPSFNENTAKGIKVGYFVRSSDGNVSYRITYDKTNSSVSENLGSLKEGFNQHIPMLAEQHAAEENTFQILAPLGAAWVEGAFSVPGDVYAKSSPLFTATMTEEKFAELIDTVKEKYGVPKNIVFSRAQYYEGMNGVPEFFSMLYSAVSADDADKKINIRINMNQRNGKWEVIGFNFNIT